MVFAVIGGDARQAELARLLEEDGHTVRRFALGGETDCATMEEAAAGADCAVLPVPAWSKKGSLNAPFSEEEYTPGRVFNALPRGCTVVGGRVDADTAEADTDTAAPDTDTAEADAAQGLLLTDVLENEALAVGNAVATAEGAVERLLRETPVTLWRSRVLVLGYGRIGRLLCRRLAAFGARASAAARKPSDRVWIEAEGFEALDIRALSGLERFDIIVNTVPARVLSETELREVRRDALLLELASAPGGFDPAAAEELGLRVIHAPGLPGKTAPRTAAALLRDCIYGILEERDGKA